METFGIRAAKAAIAFIAAATILVSCAGKVLYLGDKDAIFYRGLYYQAHQANIGCEQELKGCIDMLGELEYCQ